MALLSGANNPFRLAVAEMQPVKRRSDISRRSTYVKGGYVPEHLFELTIERLGYDGRGIGHRDGKTVFVDGALVGETVTARLVKSHSRFDEARCESIIVAGQDRVDPGCEFYGRCGGCNLQHLKIDTQRALKQSVLEEQMGRLGGQRSVVLQDTLYSAEWGYRRKARLGVKWNRQGELIIGFREKSSAHLVALTHCPVLHSDLSALIPALYELIPQLESCKTIGHLELVFSDEGCSLVVRHLKKLSHNDQLSWLNWARDHRVHLYWQPGERDTLQYGYLQDGKVITPVAPHKSLSYSLEPLKLTFLPNDFVQVNPEINRQMVAQALDWLQLKPQDTVLDLFAGFGNFSLPLAQQAASVVGVEGAKNLVEQARVNAEINGIKNAFFEVADLSQPLSAMQWAGKHYTVVVLDPPRTGAQQICEQIRCLAPGRILYVSCNPSTLARDSGILADQGYQLVKAGIMDMFPQTAHVESMALFERTGKGKKRQPRQGKGITAGLRLKR